MRDKDRYVLAIAAVLFALLGSGCNTLEGVGEDVEAAGGALEQEAEEQRGY